MAKSLTIRHIPGRAAMILIAAGLVVSCTSVRLSSHEGENGEARCEKASPFVELLWLVQEHGTPAAADPWNDQSTKAELAASMRSGSALTFERLDSLFDRETFKRLAGADGIIDPDEARRHRLADAPQSRQALLPDVAAYMRLISTGFDQIDEQHRRQGAELADWIAEHYESGHEIAVVCLCTGNSRRSLLAATLGNVSAAWCGMPEIRFYSGGTAPSAFNERTVATLVGIGIAIESTGTEAARGGDGKPNPRYHVRWGRSAPGLSLETVEFSKRYDDEHNPQSGFAALLLCSEADASCPTVKGASVRISMPYLDPKVYDDSELERAKYAERRDDIARVMLATLTQARLRIKAERK